MYVDLLGTEKTTILLNVLNDVKTWADIISLVATPLLLTPAAPVAGLVIWVTGAVSLWIGITDAVINKNVIQWIKELSMFWWWKLIGHWLRAIAKVPKVKFNFTSKRYHWYYEKNRYGFISMAKWRASSFLTNAWGLIASGIWNQFD